jgi:hypothetical protein
MKLLSLLTPEQASKLDVEFTLTMNEEPSDAGLCSGSDRLTCLGSPKVLPSPTADELIKFGYALWGHDPLVVEINEDGFRVYYYFGKIGEVPLDCHSTRLVDAVYFAMVMRLLADKETIRNS